VADTLHLSLFYAGYALVLIQFVLFCFAEKSPFADTGADDMVRITAKCHGLKIVITVRDSDDSVVVFSIVAKFFCLSVSLLRLPR